MASYYPQTREEEQWLEINEDKQAGTAKKFGPCATCGHPWRVHAMPPDIEADIDNGERWCYEGDCRCRKWLEMDKPGTVDAVDPSATSPGTPSTRA